MKNIFVSVISGAIGAAIVGAFFQSSFANNDINSAAMENALATGQCQVEIGIPYMSGTNQCYNNRVMVGQWNANIYCAEVKVTCQ